MQRNTPYVKQFDEKGLLVNPHNGYASPYPNRKMRRAHLIKSKFFGESKNCHLTVNGPFKYKREKQLIVCKDGSRRAIEHYRPVGRTNTPKKK